MLKLLDGLPLAITQAGAYIEQSGISIKTYLHLFQEQQGKSARSMVLLDAHLQDYPGRSMWTTWNLSYEAVSHINPHAANLLVFWSFIDRNDLSFDIFEEGCRSAFVQEAFAESLGKILHNKQSFYSAMNLLRSYSLVQYAQKTEGFSVHAVIHHWSGCYQALQPSQRLSILAVMAVGYSMPRDFTFASSRHFRRLLPHAQACCSHLLRWLKPETLHICIKALGCDSKPLIEKGLMAAVRIARCAGRLIAEAEKLLVQILQVQEVLLGPEDSNTLLTCQMIGRAFLDNSKLVHAENMLLRVLDGQRKLHGLKHRTTLRTIHHLGRVYQLQGRLYEAEAMMLQSLDGREEYALLPILRTRWDLSVGSATSISRKTDYMRRRRSVSAH